MTASTISRRIAVFISMLVATAIVGAIFGFLAAILGEQVLKDDLNGLGGIVGAVAGMVVGYPLGVAIGIFLVNKLLNYQGSLLFGAIGSVLVAVILIGLADPLSLINNPDLLWALIVILPPLIGTFGFYLKRLGKPKNGGDDRIRTGE